MAETTQVVVPLQGAQVNNTVQPAQPAVQERPESGFVNGVYQPPAGRVGPHQTGQRLRASMARQAEQPAELAPQWVDNPGGQGGRFQFKPVERQAEPTPATSLPQQSAPVNDALTQQISQLTNVVEFMAQKMAPQLGIELDRGPQPPNPEEFDLFDPDGLQEYRRRSDFYMQGEIERQVKAQLEPHQEAIGFNDLRKEYNACVKEFGDDPNFQAKMNLALMECQVAANEGKHLAIRDAFTAVNDPANARPGKRNAHLPDALSGRGKKIGKISLRDIMLHNQMTGRAK